jgi:aromatic-L-amino-acid decarboxylase
MAIKHMGRQGYAEVLERQIALTQYFARGLDELEGFVRLGEIETAVCCFRFIPESHSNIDGLLLDKLQQRLQQIIERGGEAWLTTTVLHGRRALRVNINSFLTEQRHVDDLLELLQRCSREAIRES